MSESPEQIRKHIEVPSEFERKYGAFLTAAHNQWAGEGKSWTEEEFATRKREIQMLATRADRAMKASGVGQLYITYPPAIGGGIKSRDLPSQVFDFDGLAFGDDGMEIQRAILDRIPSQLAGLEIKLEEAEAGEPEPPTTDEPTVSTHALPPSSREWRGKSWVNHPWTITIVGTVVAGVILYLLIGSN